MNKIILSLFLLASLASAEVKKDEVTKEDRQKSSEYFNLKNSSIYLTELEKDFEKSTGDKDFKKYLANSVKNEEWRLANYYFTFKLKEYTIPTVSGKTQKHNLQDYEKALTHFKKAVDESKDVVAAYQGFRILEKLFFYFQKDNTVVQKYLPTFAKVLSDKNYCVGTLYYARTFTSEYSSSFDYRKAADVLRNGKDTCLESEHDFYKRGIAHEYAKIKTLLKVKGVEQ